LTRWRSISELVAFLILLGVVVGAGIIVASISSSLSQKSVPKGSALLIQRVEAYGTTSSQIMVKVVATVSGSTSIAISSVRISWNTNSGVVTLSTTPQSPRPGMYLSSGSIVEITASFQTANPPNNYALVWVTIEYCDVSAVCGSVIGTTVLTPSR